MLRKALRLPRFLGSAIGSVLGDAGTGLRKIAPILLGLCVLVGGAYVVKTMVLDDEESVAAATRLRVETLAPGTFESAHPIAPYYVVPRKRFKDPSELTRLARQRLLSAPESALSKGALAGSPQIVRLSLRTTSGDPITVESVRPVVISDARPLSGWFTALPSCDVKQVRRAKIDLDARRGGVRYVGADGKGARTLGFEVGPTAPQVLELQAATTRSRIAWTAELTVRNEDGDASTVVVDDGGKPFRVTSARESDAYRPIYGASGIIGYSRLRAIERC